MMRDDAQSSDGSNKEFQRLRDSAVLVGAPAEVIDFFVPLWATAALGATPAQVGAVVAVETTFSLIGRPVAGTMADRFDTGRLGAVGAAAYALALIGFAFAPTVAVAYVAAALAGLGGALFWVALRARVSGQGGVQDFGQLLAAEGQGALLGYVVAFFLLDLSGYRAVFAAGAAAALFGALAMLALGRPPGPLALEQAGTGETPTGHARGLSRLLAPIALTAAAEAGVGIVLLLRLQRELGLEPLAIAFTLAPGFLAFVLLPPAAHVVVRALGRATTLFLGLIGSAVAAVAVGLADSALAMGGAWFVTSVFLALAIPVEESTVAELSRERPGHGAGRYEGAQLLGALMGAATLPAWYGAQGARVAGLTAAATLGLAALAIAAIVPRLGLPARPEATDRAAPPGDVDTEAGATRAATIGTEEARGSSPLPEVPIARVPDLEHAHSERVGWLWHLGLFAAGQSVLAILGESWLADRFTGSSREDPSLLFGAGRLWLWILTIDFVWSMSYSVWPRMVPAVDPDPKS